MITAAKQYAEELITKAVDQIVPGSQVIVFDPSLFVNDEVTPLAATLRPAVVVRRYGKRNHVGVYPDMVDVIFDHKPNKVSEGHLVEFVRLSKKIKGD